MRVCSDPTSSETIQQYIELLTPAYPTLYAKHFYIMHKDSTKVYLEIGGRWDFHILL